MFANGAYGKTLRVAPLVLSRQSDDQVTVDRYNLKRLDPSGQEQTRRKPGTQSYWSSPSPRHHEGISYIVSTTFVRAALRYYPFTRGRSRLTNWLGRHLAVNPSSVVRLEEGMEIELIPTQFVSRQLYFFGSFEPRETHIFRNLIGPGMTVFDIGANVGLYTLIAAKTLENQGQVYSFEPSGENFAVLKRNIKRNGFQHLVDPSRRAVSSTSGHARFLLANDGGSNHLDLTQGSAGASGTATDVETVALDSFVDEKDLSRVDVIKSDTEGAEMQVLAGAKRLLEEFKPRIFIEFSKRALNRFGHEPEELLDLLVSLRYKPYVFCSNSYRALKTTDNISNRNLLFLT